MQEVVVQAIQTVLLQLLPSLITSGIATDVSGNIYVADPASNKIRKISPQSGLVSTLAESGSQGSTDGAGASAFTIQSAGITYNFTAAGITTTTDMRLKQDVALLGNSLQKIMQLNGYSYRYKSNAAQPNRKVGMLA